MPLDLGVSRRSPTIIVPVLILSSVVGILYWEIGEFRAVTNQVARTHEAIEKINSIEKQAIDLSLGLRGFLLTGDPVFREAYLRAQKMIPSGIERLRSLASDNVLQNSRIDRLQSLMSEWEATTDLTVKMK